MRVNILFFLTFSLCARLAWAQKGNIVPNNGFEDWANLPLGWYYRASDFDYVMDLWHAPTSASPDAYGPKVRVPLSWADKGFGVQKPFAGQAMVGITVFGCDNGKPHCREYVQVKLLEPLVVGQRYVLSFWVAPLSNGLRTNNLGAVFSPKPVYQVGDGLLAMRPTVVDKTVAYKNQWQQIRLSFQAKSADEWLILGNFFPDSLTRIEAAPATQGLSFGYYYLDEVALDKQPPFLPIPPDPNDWSRVPLKSGETVVLKSVFFDTNLASIRPFSFTELDKLVALLKKRPTMTIDIQGHTDDVGDVADNQALSERRAEAVRLYLVAQGVSDTQLSARGFGEGQPLVPNTTPANRQQNRRVSFKVLTY